MAAVLAALTKHNVSLFYKPEEVQSGSESYTKMQESDDPVLYHFDKSIHQLLPFNRFYVDGMEISASELAKLSRNEMVASEYGGVTNADQDKIKSPLSHYTGIYAEDGTVNRFAKLSSLETAVSEHGCMADNNLGDFLIDLGDHIEDFGQYEQPSFTSHHSTGYIPSKYLSESISDMSFPLASTPLSACQDKMLVDTQFSANNTVPSLASFNEDLAQTEQFDEGEEFMFIATYPGVRGCEVDTMQEIQDSIKKL